MTAIQQWMFSSVRLPASEVPEGAVFVEQFEAETYPTLYTGLPGPGIDALFTTVATPDGLGLNMGSNSGGAAVRVVRSVTPESFHTLEFKFKINGAQTDDAGTLSFHLGGSGTAGIELFWNPKREPGYDILRRAEFEFQGETAKASAAALSDNVWYRTVLTILPGAGNSTIETFVVGGALVFSTTLVNSHTPISFDRMILSMDGGLGTIPTVYDDIFAVG
jgi:hypothetical protein